jgi:S-adenosylmethionine decarboxylase proenzyme
MQGLHLTADLRGCPADRLPMTDLAALRRLCMAAAQDAGLQPVGELFHRFEPAPRAAAKRAAQAHGVSGVTGVVLLAESHLAVHTWPELGVVTLDVYVCNVNGDHSHAAQRALDGLIEGFGAREVARQALRRGTAWR